jgi:hypothetical protein
MVFAVDGCSSSQPAPASKPVSSASTQTASASATKSASVVSQSSTASSKTAEQLDDEFLWGIEINLDRFVELAKSNQIDYVEWFAEQDRLRIFTIGGEKLNYKNQVTRIDIPKYLESKGVKVGEGGLRIEFET